MRRLLNKVTNRIITKKGVWLALVSWVMLATVLSFVAPKADNYKVTSVDTLPESAQSVKASEKLDSYFPGSDGIPALLVFEGEEQPIEIDDISNRLENLENANIDRIKEVFPLWLM